MGAAPFTPIHSNHTGSSEQSLDYSLKPQVPLYTTPNSTLSTVLPGVRPSPAAGAVAGYHAPSPDRTASSQPPPPVPTAFPPASNPVSAAIPTPYYPPNPNPPTQTPFMFHSSLETPVPYPPAPYPPFTYAPTGAYPPPPPTAAVAPPHATGVYPPVSSRGSPWPHPPPFMGVYPPPPPAAGVYPPPHY